MIEVLSKKADLLILLAVAIFGAGYPIFLRFFPIPFLTFLFGLQVVGFLIYGFILKKGRGMDPLSPRLRILLVGLAVAATLNDLTLFWSYQTTTVANAALAHQSVSIFLLLLAPWLLGERTKREEWLALATAAVGVVILYSAPRYGNADRFYNHPLGITLGLASGLFYALIIILYRILQGRESLPLSGINTYRFAWSSLLLLPVVWLTDTLPKPHEILPVLVFGALFAGVASGIHNWALGRARSLHASIIGKADPVFGVLAGFFVFREVPSSLEMLGGTLILGASLWLAFRERGAS